MCLSCAGSTSSQDPGAAWPQGNPGSDVGVTGQPVGPAAVATQAGLKAAEHGAHGSEQASTADGAPDQGRSGALSADVQKALSDALVVLFKKNSVVNQTDVRCVLLHSRRATIVYLLVIMYMTAWFEQPVNSA